MRRHIPQEILEEISHRIDIVELVNEYVPLKKTGRNYRGLCPFHTEKTPSFFVTPDKGIFHCFGCGTGGDCFSFLMKIRNFTFPEACEELAKRAGVALPRPKAGPEQEARDRKHRLLFRINEIAGDHFHDVLLHGREGQGARDYLRDRGISDEMVGKFRLGFAIKSWEGMVRHLAEKRVPRELASEVGLIMPGKKVGYYDRFRGRLMFPIEDLGGSVIGFGGRVIDNEEPKYLNSPESAIYEKGKSIYGLPITKEAIRQHDSVIVVEGYFDLIALSQHGIENVVATLGTAFTPAQIAILRRYTKNVIMIYDSDEAGQKAMQRSLESLLEGGMSTKYIPLPAGSDPDSAIRTLGAEEFRRRLDGARPLLESMIEDLAAETRRAGVADRSGAVRKILPLLNKIQDRIKRDLYVKLLSEAFGLDTKAVLLEMKSVGTGRRSTRSTPAAQPQNGHRQVEETILGIALANMEGIKPDELEEAIADFSTPEFIEIGEMVVEGLRAPDGRDLKGLIHRVSESQRTMISKLMFKANDLDEETAGILYRDSLKRVKRNRIKQEIRDLREEISMAERRGDEEKWRKLLERQKDLALEEKALQ
ncbi:DNA primase [Thermodesulfobacteriota bacterium]